MMEHDGSLGTKALFEGWKSRDRNHQQELLLGARIGIQRDITYREQRELLI